MGKEEARRQGSAKARGGRARRTRWARREADGSSVPITAIVHVVPRPSHLTRGALVRPVGAAEAWLELGSGLGLGLGLRVGLGQGQG